jgi:outer membrane protein
LAPVPRVRPGPLALADQEPVEEEASHQQLARQASQQQLLSVERQTDQNTRNTYWQVQNGVNIVKAQETALKSAKTKLDSDQLGYQVGVRNSVDLVNSQKNYYQTFQTYQQSRYQYLMARIQLRYLSGSVNSDFIKQMNQNIKN